jgi:hypothetical protein
MEREGGTLFIFRHGRGDFGIGRPQSVCLVDGQLCMGDDPDFCGWMVNSMVDPFFVWLEGFEGWDDMCFNLLLLAEYTYIAMGITKIIDMSTRLKNV